MSARTWCCLVLLATGRCVARKYMLHDVVLLLCRVLCRRHWSASPVVLSAPASFCCVVFTCLVLLCCLYLPRSVVSTASKSLTVSNNATRYGLMRLTGLIDSGKVALDVKNFSLNICHFNLLVGVTLCSLPRYLASGASRVSLQLTS